MEENFVYTIVYFKDSEFFMISANCFRKYSLALQCARDFCDLHEGDGSVWHFEIDTMQMIS